LVASWVATPYAAAWPDRRFFFIRFFGGGGRRPVCGFVFFKTGNGGPRALFLFLPPKFDVFGQAPGRYLFWCLAGAQLHSSALRDMPMHRFLCVIFFVKVAERSFYCIDFFAAGRSDVLRLSFFFFGRQAVFRGKTAVGPVHGLHVCCRPWRGITRWWEGPVARAGGGSTGRSRGPSQ
jgi:hypothetical protein